VARACLEGLGVAEAGDEGAMARAAAGFEALPSRYRSLGAVAGVEFIDDSLSTNVLPTLAALDALEGRPVALLVGGRDRGIDYAPLGRALAARSGPTLVVALPDCGPRIAAALTDAPDPGHAEVRRVDSLAEGVEAAFAWARPLGAVVLLSPAAPSFGHFRDYRDRSAAFAEAMEACRDGAVSPGAPAPGG
jgi:UDP-N-acetylmuramoylalanine--D-glutamate ligase